MVQTNDTVRDSYVDFRSLIGTGIGIEGKQVVCVMSQLVMCCKLTIIAF